MIGSTGLRWGIRAMGMAVLAATLGASGPAGAERFGTTIPMRDKGASTYYVDSYVSGLGAAEMMVDTGSGYLTINEVALKAIAAQGKARYVKLLRAVLANGKELTVPVYRLDALRIGSDCWLHDVPAAVFPGNTRLILGLSALSKAAPFIFAIEPPQLVLSHCGKELPEEPTAAGSDMVTVASP